MTYINDVLGPGGVLARTIPGFAVRDGQLDFARAVDRAFRDGTNLLAEAPCGVGKTLGYAVPAIYAAVGESFGSRKVVIATANIALQEQIVGTDLPLLASTLPWPFRFALAKGRANFACLARADDVAAEVVLAGLSGERDEFARVQSWLDVTDTGDLSELPFEMTPDLRRRLTVTADECVGKSCERYDDCYANKAYRALPDAHVVVTNQHMLLADLTVRRATGGEAGVLPTYDLLIVDEVHKLLETARSFAGFRVTPGSIRWSAKLLAGAKGKRAIDPIDTDLKRKLDDAAGSFETFLRSTRRSPDYKARLREPVRDDGWHRLVDLLREAGDTYLRTAATRALPPGRKVEVMKQGVRAQLLADQVEEALTVARAGEKVYFVEEDDRGRVALTAKSISVANDLRAMLFGGDAPTDDSAHEIVAAKGAAPGQSYTDVSGYEEQGGYADRAGSRLTDRDGEARSKSRFDGEDWPKDEEAETPVPRRAIRSVIGTSATIRTGSSFSYVKRELGAENARELTAASPFDYHEQALLVFPEGMPDPRDRGYVDAVAETLSEVVGLAAGRTLGLFTSYKSLSVAHARVVAEHGARYRVMRQGEAPRTQLVQAFREDVSSVLLGTESFAEGVDVPGPALSVVFIDKLPFAPPDDPVLDALQDAHPRDWFQRYSVPRAVIAFRQRVGRLIRSVSDRGVVVVCDPRVLGKGYGRTFLRSLPEMRVSQCLADIPLFLAQGPAVPPEPAKSFEALSAAPASLHRLVPERGQPGSANAGVQEALPGPLPQGTGPGSSVSAEAREGPSTGQQTGIAGNPVADGLRALSGRRRRSAAGGTGG